MRCFHRPILIYQLAPWPSPTSPGADRGTQATATDLCTNRGSFCAHQARRLPVIGTCLPTPLNQWFLDNVSTPRWYRPQRRVGPGLRQPSAGRTPSAPNSPPGSQLHAERESYESKMVVLFRLFVANSPRTPSAYCSGFH